MSPMRASGKIGESFHLAKISSYSGTSEKGLSVLRTQYKKPLYKGQDFLPQTLLSMQFKPLKKENLSIKDN